MHDIQVDQSLKNIKPILLVFQDKEFSLQNQAIYYFSPSNTMTFLKTSSSVLFGKGKMSNDLE